MTTEKSLGGRLGNSPGDSPGNNPGSSQPPAIEFDNVTLRYPRQKTPALQSISFSLPQNAVCGLFGRNAAGKTTLMSLISAYRRPTSGTVRVWGQDPYENPQVTPDIAFVYQTSGASTENYINYLTVKEHLQLASRIRPNWDGDFAEQLVKRFNLSRKKVLYKLSHGQRAALRCVLGLAGRAPLTIFDEAYLGMDAVYRKVFVDALLQDYLAHPRTILFSTHYISEMERLFTEAIIIEDGRVLEHSDCDQMRASGKSLQDYFISMTLKEGEIYEF